LVIQILYKLVRYDSKSLHLKMKFVQRLW